MGIDFDPDAFLARLRENSSGASPPAKVAKAAKLGEAEVTLATLAGRLPLEEIRTLAALATLADDLPHTEKSRVNRESCDCLALVGARPPAKVAKALNFSLHLRLVNALARELFDDGGPSKTWLIDPTVRARTPLIEQVPEG